uniref:Uncharacterized protein n=1 Tax=Ananas comosus var. bracteatus TaxID=296719 RepID=A0A6V7NHP3_ANACO|nr:unnamed protein product [Ananas comosus var. bracteatus]
MWCQSCRGEYEEEDAGTCKECYDEASETKEELKREIDDLKSKVEFLRLASPLHDHHLHYSPSSASPSSSSSSSSTTDLLLHASPPSSSSSSSPPPPPPSRPRPPRRPHQQVSRF